MLIVFDSLLPNGVTATTHRLARVEITDTARVTVNSFVSAEADMLVWQDIHEMPVSELASGVYPDCVYNWLVSASGPFAEGLIA